MTVFICVDVQGGVLFNRRRVSSDRNVIADVVRSVGDGRLFMRSYSKSLFPENTQIFSCEDYWTLADKGDFVFFEDAIPGDFWTRVQRVVVYYWNRHYPSDVKMPLQKLHQCGQKESSKEFAGFSHERITREVYLL